MIRRKNNMEENNILIQEVDFSQELYEKNIAENTFKTEYEAGEENGDN
jgi:hypothetical protein